MFKVLELAGPDDAISGRQLHILRDFGLRVRDRRAEVAAAHAKLDREEALPTLVIDIGGARVQADGCELAQRNIGVAAGAAGHLDIAYRVDAVAVFGRKTNDEAELAVALEHGRRGRATHGGLDDCGDVAGIEAEAGGFLAIHLDVQIRLPKNVEYPEIGDPLDLIHFVHDFVGEVFKNLEVRTDGS